jgi:hypothetical protein
MHIGEAKAICLLRTNSDKVAKARGVGDLLQISQGLGLTEISRL